MKKILAVTALLLVMIFSAGYAAAGESTEAFQQDYERVKAMVDKVEHMKTTVDQMKTADEQMKAASKKVLKEEIRITWDETRKLYKKHPTSADVSFLVARCLYYNDRPGKALRALKKVHHYDPSHVEGHALAKKINAEMHTESEESSAVKKSADKAYNKTVEVKDVSKEKAGKTYKKVGGWFKSLTKKKEKPSSD